MAMVLDGLLMLVWFEVGRSWEKRRVAEQERILAEWINRMPVEERKRFLKDCSALAKDKERGGKG